MTQGFVVFLAFCYFACLFLAFFVLYLIFESWQEEDGEGNEASTEDYKPSSTLCYSRKSSKAEEQYGKPVKVVKLKPKPRENSTSTSKRHSSKFLSAAEFRPDGCGSKVRLSMAPESTGRRGFDHGWNVTELRCDRPPDRNRAPRRHLVVKSFKGASVNNSRPMLLDNRDNAAILDYTTLEDPRAPIIIV